MKKLRKRIFAAVLAAFMIVTAMPATALYASAETGSVSGNAAGQAGTDDTEETGDGDTEETETDDAEETGDSDTEAVGTDTAECICKTLCTEDSINGDCPVCGADDASLLDCKGKVSEENTENQEDTGICKHHQEHDADCGYIPKSENGEGSPCTYECRICPIEVLIAALPDTVTEDNAADVRAQLDKILALYREMNEDEQGQLDLSRVTELQGALDGANAPMTAEGRTEQQETDEASVTIGGETLYYATLEEAFAAANGKTATITMLADAECIHSGSNGSPLNITSGNVTLNLNGKTLSGKGYGNFGIIDVSGGSLLVEGEGNISLPNGAIGLSCYSGGTLTVAAVNIILGSDSSTADAGVDNEGGTVILNGTQMTGAASNGQIYHESGTTTIHNVTATGVTENAPKSVCYNDIGTLKINGGTFDQIAINSTNNGGVTSVAELLGEGCAYKKQDGTWATADEMAGLEISNVTVAKIPLTIQPQGDTSWYYSTQQTHTLAMSAAPVSGGTVTYVWKNGEETLDCTSDACTVPAGMPVGSYTYTCEATCDGYTLSHTFTFKIEKSGTDLADGKVKTYNGDTQTTTFNADDTITVKAVPTATGTAPQKAAARLRSDYTAPTEGQMALFVGDVQVSEPVQAGEGGTYTMTVSAADVLLQGNAEQNGNAVTLTAKFVGNDNMADAAGTVDVRISAVAKAELDGKVIGYYGESNLDKAFANDGATVTLLDNITTSMHIGVDTGNLTLDLNGKTITKPASYGLYVSGSGHLTIRGNGKVICTGTSGFYPEAITSVGGTLTLEGGTFIGLMYGVRVDWETSVLSVTGESVSIQGERYGLRVAQAQSVQLSAGTYSSISVYTFNTLASLLAENCAYYKGSTPIRLSELADQKELTGPVTVQKCQHTAAEYTPNENDASTHTKTCLACGYTETGDCGFEKTADPTADSHTGQCPDCKRDRSGAHSFSDWAGNPVARICTVCGYEQTAVARVEKDSTTTYVGALADAFTEGNSGATVTLLSEVDLGSNYISIRESNTFTLDLNGQTVKASYYDAFDISGGSLTIQDSGTGGKIESSDITIEVTGGTLSIQSGTVSGHTGVQISSGAVNISGGTISGSDTGLKVTGGGNIAISGGTFSGVIAVEIHSNASVTLKDLLAAGYAYHQNDIPVANAAGPGGEVPLDAKPAWLTGTVTVKECNHTGGLVPSENGYQHGGPCKCCGAELTAANHTLGADNQCSGCGAELVAKVEKSGSDTVYVEASNLASAFAAENTGATVTLLKDVDLGENDLTLLSGTFTLDCGAFTLSSSSEYFVIKLDNADLTFAGGTIQCNGTGNAVLCAIGTFTMTGGTLNAASDYALNCAYSGEANIQGGTVGTQGKGLCIGNPDTVKLSGGTYATICIVSNYGAQKVPLSTILADGRAAYGPDGPITRDTVDAELTGPIIVKECEHDGVTVQDQGNGKHGLDCPYCGYHYEHTTALTATASGNTVTLNGGCGTEGCGYQTTLGTASFTFPKVTYGQSGDVTCAWDGPTGYYGLIEVIGGSQSQFDKNADEGIAERSWTLAQLFGSTKVTAGEHKLKVSFCSDVVVRSNACELDFKIDPAPLTADMVTLSAESATYSGIEQKPALSVRQGQTALNEGTDYEVSYTRDGVVTNDFTSAGTVKITVTGKGNYGGEVEKTFTIKQAEPDVGTVTAETLENTLDVSQVVLSRTNQTPAGTLTLTDSALKYGTNTYTWKFTPDDTVNYKTVTGEVQVTVNDTIPPAAEYQLGTDGWKKFINTISSGLFCNDYKTVTIRGTDDTDTVTGSGISMIQYSISDQEITDMDSIVWETYTKPISLDALGKYFIYVKVTDNAGNTAVLNSEGIVIYAESTVSPAVFDYTYKENRDCTVQLAMNGNTFKGFTDREGNAVGINDYTIDGDGRLILKAAYLDTLDQGEYAYTVSVNPQGIETDQVTLAYTFTVNVKARELTVTGAAAAGRAYDGTNKVEIMAVTLDGIVGSDTVAVDVSGIQGALSSANAGTYTAVTLPELTLTGADSGNYILVQPQAAVPTSVTITPLSAVITVGTDTYHKTFGDAAFTLDVTDNNAEADVQYEVTKGTDVVSVENGTVTIQSAGTAEIRVSLPASTNYNAAENKTITVRVDKKSGYTVAALNRNYFYQDGGTDSIDLAALLPKDCGDVTYGEPAVSGNVTYSAAPAVSGGKLSYTLDSGSVNDAGTVTVTVATRNYEDITVTVNVKLTDQIPVSLKTGTEVTLENNILTYGEPLSKLAFNEAEFVTADGESVTGTLAWKEAAATPNAGTASAVWIFTPVEDKYASLEGTAAITVNKAVPTVSAVPTVADRIYNPSVTLKGDDLTGTTVTGVDGNTLKGGWNWQSADIVPTVNNNGYAAIFTPEDTTNYETVTRTITVNVAKATPYIAKSPAAAGITYGDILNASALSGGTVQYGNGAGQAGDGAGSTAAVAGTFTWKEPSAKPVVADSNVTGYTVVFTPSDTANYNPVEAKVTLTVNKVQNAPNMPGSTMDVSNSLEKVGDVSLPEGWEWQASDQDTALEVGKPVSAVAVYAGADKGNYENETVTVAITRSACDHVAGEILYTGAGEKAPTCTEDGLGHRECTKCGSVVESGIVVKAPGHTGGTATCSKRAVCTRCGQPYGDTDGSVHGDTEVRGFVAATCTAGGYTGDTYCKDCGAKTKTGNATPALGHNYTSMVTKEPTTGSEGTRTYTCTRCGHSYTESIPKLPEETHHHSYSGSVTKQPTCTDTGVRTYTCSCGDSYTETIAALGHHYQSSVTKQPTATSEGVMTYTCDRCGHSYTRPIAKLPGEGTTDPGTSQPGDTEPGSGSTETRPDTGIPFIKGGDGRTGWDVIRAEEEQAQDGSIINVDMNGSVVVPGDIFDSIKGKDITITFDMGNGIIWSVDGKSITTDKAGDIDFSVQTGVNTVPVDIVNNVTGERYSIQISLAHEGEFGFTAVLSIGLGKENAGYTASLYYYNENTGELELICKDQVAEDGTVSLAFTHASDYVIAIDGDGEESGSTTEPEQPDTPDKDSTGEAESPKTGQAWRPWWFIVAGALVIVMGIGVFLAVRKKQETENS